MYATEVSYGVSSSKNIIPMFSKIPRHWLIRFVIGCGQFWLLPRTAEEKNDLDAQRNQAGVRSESAASTKQRDTELSEGSVGCGTPWEMRIAAILFTRCRGHASLLWRAVTRPAEKLLVAESVIEKSINPRGISAGKSFVGVCIAMLRTFHNAA